MAIISHLKIALAASNDCHVPNFSIGTSVFYKFLLDSFHDAPGFSLVLAPLAQRFKVMNGYNDYPISPEVWRAVIQPNTKIAMAMLVLNGNVVKHGSCANALCPGKVSFTNENQTCICPVCGKHIYRLTESKPSIITPRRDNILPRGNPNSELRDKGGKYQLHWNATMKEIAAFKRVILWDLGSRAAREGEKARESRTGGITGFSEYFVPENGIDCEVITTDICRYLGEDATVRSGTYNNPETEQIMEGYFVKAYRNLTTAMIEDLKSDSARWEAEKRGRSESSEFEVS